MLGRFARNDTLAAIGLWKLLGTVVAGALVAAAAVVEYGTTLPPYVTIVLVTASLGLTGFPIVWGAVQGLIRREANVDELVSIAIIASMILGEWISAGVVAWIMVLGSLIEEYTSQRARRHIEALAASSPEVALLVSEDGGTVRIPVAELEPGQWILARPGDVVAADGFIEQGDSQLDESMLTGESVPVAKTSGDRVFAGSTNLNGSLVIRVERVGADSTQGKVIQLVREAERHRAPILRAAEAYAKWFTPTVLLLAAAVWLVTAEPLRAVTVLIVGCPCAFVLATPTAIIAALGRASRHGILIKGGKYLEACAQIEVLAFDKTGTLTTGNCRVREVIPLAGATTEELLRHAARLESGAEHPLAWAILERAKQAGVDVASASIRREAGLGVSEITDGEEGAWHIGNRRFIQRKQVTVGPDAERRADALRDDGYSPLFLSRGNTLQGLLAVEDQARGEAPATLHALRKSGYEEIYVLTGDGRPIALRLGERLDVPSQRVLAELLPEDKFRFIASVEREGRRVCYVGDGTNDGPALAVASVGVSIGSRENTVALETADVVLMRDGLAGLPFLFRLAKATTRTINQNLILLGLAFNAAMLCLSSFGVLSPILGALGHNVGSVGVVLNSARLLRFAPDSPIR
ncbi:MAG: heavy metal translocating P-type ATPase [Planctomycetota bacterium]|jgi:Cd2+/Zn2+-exporting ATPase